MAVVHRIANSDGTITYNFLTAVLKIKADDWTTSIDSEGRTVESMILVGKDTDANIIAAAQTIAELQESVKLFSESPFNYYSIWYEYSATAETAKRALIYDIQFKPVPRSVYGPTLGKGGSFYSLVITHSSKWEDRTFTSAWGIGGGTFSCLGGTVTLAAIKGSLPARLSQFVIGRYAGSGVAADPITRLWTGIRPTRYGVSSFVPKWELEDGTAVEDTAGAIETGASIVGLAPANCMECDFATKTGLYRRVLISIDDVIADTNYNHFIGSYLVLLRYKLSAAGTVGVQMRTGFVDNAPFAPHEEKYVTSTAWRYVELGEISIPPFSVRSDSGALHIQSFEIGILAERLSGTPSIFLDCLILIPSEHIATATGSDVYFDATPDPDESGIANYYSYEDGETSAVGLFSVGAAVSVNVTLDYTFRNWEIPIDGGLFVMAGEQEALQDLDDVVSASMYYYPRHRVHREA